jgi:DNA-binding CsgD family transcriptional regulator
MILEVVDKHIRPKEHIKHGQTLWMAVSVNDPPTFHKRISNTKMAPVILDLSTSEDIDMRLEKNSAAERITKKAVRLCEQAYEQGGLLSNSDLAELLCYSDSYISLLLTTHEKKTGKLVPRRATLHDMGSGLTHKRIICYKRYAQGKSSDQIARETYHSIEAVDRYLGQYDRVRHCRLQGLAPAETAHALGCGERLVREYLDIDRQLQGKET